MAARDEGESPTSSQLARKRLGFENLFDQTDPDVQEIDDVVDMGLLSGRSVPHHLSGSLFLSVFEDSFWHFFLDISV